MNTETELKQAELEKLVKKAELVSQEKEVLEEQIQRQLRINAQKQEELTYKKNLLDDLTSSKKPNSAANEEFDLKEWLKEKFISYLETNSQNTQKRTGMKDSKNTPMLIPCVVVKFAYELQDGNFEEFEKLEYYEGCFKINKRTKFQEIKKVACDFWSVSDPEHYSLRANNFSNLDLLMKEPLEETVLSQRIMPEFWLFRVNTQAQSCFTSIEDCFIEPSLQNQFRIKQPKASKTTRSKGFNRREHEANFKKLKRLYPGLSSYQTKQINLEEDLHEAERIKGKYGSFLSAVAILLALVSTIVILFIRRDVTTDYWIQNGIHSSLMKEYSSEQNFFDVSSLKDLDMFVKNVFAPALFKKESFDNYNLLDRLYLVGPVRFRQVRTKQTDCTRKDEPSLEGFQCYFTEYSQETKETEPIGKANYQVYRSEEESQVRYQYEGEFSKYDGSGYIIDFNPKNTTIEQFISFWNQEVIQKKWLNVPSRALIITCNFYSKTNDKFVPLLIVFEINPVGLVYPSTLRATVTRINLYKDTPEDNCALAFEVIRLVFSLYFLYLYLALSFRDVEGNRNWLHFVSVKGILDLALFCLIVAAFSMSFTVKAEESEIFKESYHDLNETAEKYTTCIVLNAWILLLLTFRLVYVFRVSRKVQTFLMTLDMSSKNIACLILILSQVFVGLWLLSIQIWGPFNFNYRTPAWAILTNILFTVGVGSTEELLKINDIWTIVFFYIYFFFVVFFLFSAFLGIYMDSFRTVKQWMKEAGDSKDGFKRWALAPFKKD